MKRLAAISTALGLLVLAAVAATWMATRGSGNEHKRAPVYEISFTMSQHKNGPSGEALFEALYLTRADGSGLRRLQPNARGVSIDEFLWSPGGRFIAFTRKTSKAIDVYLMNADGSGVRRLNRLGNRNMAESWSPNEEKLLIRNYGLYPNCECGCDPCFIPSRYFITRIAGGKPQRLFPTARNSQGIGWTSDDRILMALQKGRSPVWDIFAVRSEQSFRRLTPAGFDFSETTASRDGQTFTLIGEKATWLMGSDGKILRRFPGVRGFISPDGRSIAYECKGVCVVKSGERRARRVLEFPPEYPARSGCFADPVWSPDSRSIAVEIGACVNNSTRIMVANVDGTDSHYLALVKNSAVQYQSRPTWSPDSRSIAFTWHALQPPSAFYVARADGNGVPVRLAATRQGYAGLIAWRPVASGT